MTEFEEIKKTLEELQSETVDFTDEINEIEKCQADPPIPLWLIKLIIKLAKRLKG